jgi:hypothetical protein
LINAWLFLSFLCKIKSGRAGMGRFYIKYPKKKKRRSGQDRKEKEEKEEERKKSRKSRRTFLTMPLR